MVAHDVGCGSRIESVQHPLRIGETVIGERRIITIQSHSQGIQAGGARRIPILIAGQLNGELQM